jgi:hypothetical protein
MRDVSAASGGWLVTPEPKFSALLIRSFSSGFTSLCSGAPSAHRRKRQSKCYIARAVRESFFYIQTKAAFSLSAYLIMVRSWRMSAAALLALLLLLSAVCVPVRAQDDGAEEDEDNFEGIPTVAPLTLCPVASTSFSYLNLTFATIAYYFVSSCVDMLMGL